MKTFEETSALQTRNAELIRMALPSMPEHVKRFLEGLGKKISPEMYAQILNMDTLVLTKILVGLRFLPIEEQIKLPSMSVPELGNLLFSFATTVYHSVALPLAIESGTNQLPRIREVINQETGQWEYLFLKSAWLPNPDKQYEHEGYTYTFLRAGPEGLFFSRRRSDNNAAFNRDFSDELCLTEYFARLVQDYGKHLIIKPSDFWAVKHLISSYDFDTAGDKIFLFLQGIFVYSAKAAQEKMDFATENAIKEDRERFCNDWHKAQKWGTKTLPQPKHAPLKDLSNAETLLAEYHTLKASYSLPSYTVEVEESGNNAIVHRTQPDIEFINGVAYVRIYQTVYAVSYGVKYKDVIQESDGKVKIITHGDKMWLNMGWPLRAFHYIRTYQAQGMRERSKHFALLDHNAANYDEKKTCLEFLHGLPVIRVFLISKDFHDEYTMSAISESQVNELGENHTLNVDKAKAPNQYGVTAADEKMVAEHILPGSLTTYVQDGEEWRYTDPRNGTVLPISVLEKRLGLPTSDNPYMLDMSGTKVPGADQQKENAERLAELYDLTCKIESGMKKVFQSDSDQWANVIGQFDDLIGLWNKLAQVYKITFPTSLDEFYKVKSQIEQAATFSLIPSLIRENYEEARARVHMVGLDQRTGERISLWTEMQHFTLIPYPSIKSDMPKSNSLTEENVRKHLGTTCNQLIEVLIGYLNSDELGKKELDESDAEVQELLAYILYLATHEHIHGKDVSIEEELALYKKVLFERVSSQVKRVTELSTLVVVLNFKALLDAVLPSNLEAIKFRVLGMVNQGISVNAKRLLDILQLEKYEHQTIAGFLKGLPECTSLEGAALQSGQIQALIKLIEQEPIDKTGREYNRYQGSLAGKINKIIGG